MSTRSDTEGARLLSMLEDMGEADLIFRGIHENMLGLRYMDTNMTRTAHATSHVAEADVLLRQCGRRGDFSLIRYLPPVALCVRQQVAGPSRYCPPSLTPRSFPPSPPPNLLFMSPHVSQKALCGWFKSESCQTS